MKEIMELKNFFNSNHRADAIVSVILTLPIVLAGLISVQNDSTTLPGGIAGVIWLAYYGPIFLFSLIIGGLGQLFYYGDPEAGGTFLLALILKTIPFIWLLFWSGIFFALIKLRRIVRGSEPVWKRYLLSLIISLTLSISSLVVFGETNLLALCLNGKSLIEPWICFRDLTEDNLEKIPTLTGKMQYCQQFSATKTVIPNEGSYTYLPNMTHRELCAVQVASNSSYGGEKWQKINTMPQSDEYDRLREEAISQPTADACKLYGQLEKSNYAKDRCLSRFIQLGPTPYGLDYYCPALSNISLEPRCLDWSRAK